MNKLVTEAIRRHLRVVQDEEGIEEAVIEASAIAGASIAFLWGLTETCPEHERDEIRAIIRAGYSKYLAKAAN